VVSTVTTTVLKMSLVVVAGPRVGRGVLIGDLVVVGEATGRYESRELKLGVEAELSVTSRHKILNSCPGNMMTKGEGVMGMR